MSYLLLGMVILALIESITQSAAQVALSIHPKF